MASTSSHDPLLGQQWEDQGNELYVNYDYEPKERNMLGNDLEHQLSLAGLPIHRQYDNLPIQHNFNTNYVGLVLDQQASSSHNQPMSMPNEFDAAKITYEPDTTTILIQTMSFSMEFR